MKVSELQKITKVLAKISNQNSISELFRCTELSSEAIRACSEWGNIEVWVGIPTLHSPVLINTASFIAVISSLPVGAEIEIIPEPNQLAWKCDNAKGHWSLLLSQQKIPIISSNKNFSWIPPKDFPDALELASSACLSMTVSVGLFGVIIERLEDSVRMTSSNSISLATSKVILDGYPTKETITLRPPVPGLLANLLRIEPDAKLDVCSDGIFLLSNNLVAHLPLSGPLEHNLSVVINRFNTRKEVIAINAKAINQFLTRAKGLSDKQMPCEVTLEITNGKLLLEQRSAASSSEEYFLATGIDENKVFNSVILPLNLMVTSLSHVKEVVLDYLPSNILTLRGDVPEFMQIIGGKAKIDGKSTA